MLDTVNSYTFMLARHSKVISKLPCNGVELLLYKACFDFAETQL